jgi:hypothetical protein
MIVTGRTIEAGHIRAYVVTVRLRLFGRERSFTPIYRPL